MKQLLIVLGLLICTFVYADEPRFLAGYDYYKEPNNHNYEDAWGFTFGIEHDISGNLKGQLVYKHITDVVFPAVQDPKGAWGELRGHVPFYNLKYNMPYNDSIGFYLTGGIGYAFWDFRENPFLQDANVTVDAKNSIVVQFGVGLDLNIWNGWNLTLESGWFDTDIEKEISENDAGIVNILDSGDIGLQYIPVKVGVRKKF